ncbi:AmmeMemoRadiSam system protein B [bacterium]|nr:AmmeMemoRadiSam system protein B [bacterium]
MFYPADTNTLIRVLDSLLAQAPAEKVVDLRGLISPHAGYQFSGAVAARGYKLLAGRPIRTVILMAPSHYAAFRGVYVSPATVWRTPLGDVPVSPKARLLAGRAPFTMAPDARVERPGWWRQSPITIPPFGEDTPETWEHSAEVQVPFLQRVLKDFELVPLVFGDVDPAAAAEGLIPLLDDQTLVIASSDLSHYHPYDEARARDQRCVQAVCALDIESMKQQEACGAAPILTLMHLARRQGWSPQLLDYRNSGDTSGNREGGVVGYAAIAFGRGGPAAAPAPATLPAPRHTMETHNFNPQERRQLLDLARRALDEVVTTGRLPAVDPAGYPPKFTEPAGCFVTLTKRGQLRGCIGHIVPQESLYRAIMDNTKAAALQDQRFDPVQTNELTEIEIEISVLTVPQPLAFGSPEDLLERLQPHRDGVLLRLGERGATYLPQVWEQIPDKVQFLDSLAVKAGGAPGDWRQPGTRVFIYHVEAWHEGETK